MGLGTDPPHLRMRTYQREIKTAVMEDSTLGTILRDLRCMDDRARVRVHEQLDIINASLIVCIGKPKAPMTCKS